jgi:GNAT superfamily N-acetyltransferase
VSRIERVGIEAYRAFYGSRAVDLGGGVVVLCGREAPEVPMVNRVAGLGVASPATEELLDEALALLRGTRCYVALAPGARPAELTDWLQARGFEPGWGWMQLTRGVEPLSAASELELVQVDEARSGDFARIVGRAYGLPERALGWIAAAATAPGWTAWLALAGGEPAAAAGLFVRERAAYLGFAGTLPEHRGKGAQSALLAERIRRAAELGCDLVVTETGERRKDLPSNSYRNILRAGFEERFVVANWVGGPAG